jgi:hypothetical protein
MDQLLVWQFWDRRADGEDDNVDGCETGCLFSRMNSGRYAPWFRQHLRAGRLGILFTFQLCRPFTVRWDGALAIPGRNGRS